MKTSILIAVVLAVVCLTPGWCQGGHGPGGPGMPSAVSAIMPPHADMIDGLSNSLSLTTDQASSLKTILTEADTTIKPLVQASGDAAKALRDAIFATTYDADTVTAAVETSEAADAAVVSACVDAWVKIRAILTSDQIALLQECPGPGAPPDGSSGASVSSFKHR